jgi:hypothetical protein
MDTLIKCPSCGAEIPLSDAFKHEIEADILATERERHRGELSVAIKSADEAAAKKALEDAARLQESLRADAAGQ